MVSMWHFQPDWSQGVRFTYEFKTEVIQSRNGSEQRIAWRTTPRVTVEYTVTANARRMRNMFLTATLNQDEQMKMPIWTRGANVAETFSGVTMTTDVPTGWVTSGQEVVIFWGDDFATQFEFATISSRDGLEITLGAAPSVTIPAGAVMYPIHYGHLSASVASRALTDQTVTMSVVFEADPGFEDLEVLGPATLYQGREIMLQEPDWSEDVSVTFKTTLDILDYGIGQKTFFDPVGYNDRYTTFSYFAASKPDALNVVRFFRRMYGQQGEFFMPTFMQDIEIRHNQNAGDTTIRAIGAKFTELDGDPVYKKIAIYFVDGSVEVFGVTSISIYEDSVGKDSVFALDRAIPMDLIVKEISMISWLTVARFATDTLSVDWRSDDVADIGFSVKTLKALNPE